MLCNAEILRFPGYLIIVGDHYDWDEIVQELAKRSGQTEDVIKGQFDGYKYDRAKITYFSRNYINVSFTYGRNSVPVTLVFEREKTA
nr:MAG TPA: hypothetical protein [Caudoviricetes sp.]